MSPLSLHALLLLAGILALYYGAEWLVRGASRLAGAFGVKPIVVGLTIVSLGTSAPELVVSLLAALGGNPGLAMGNVMGSNLANLGLILGVAALVSPLGVAARVVGREIPLMLLVTGLLYPLVLDHDLDRLDGLALLLFLAFYLVFVFRAVEEETPAVLQEYEEFVRESDGGSLEVRPVDVLLVAGGCAALVAGGYWIVEGAVFLASAFGVSQVVIGITVVAVGTSLPELATSLVAATRGEADIAVGNVVGSNIFNVAGILGATAVVQPMEVAGSILVRELPAVLVVSLLVVPAARTGWQIQRWEGALLLGTYLVLGAWLV